MSGLDPMHPLVLGLGPAAPLGPESVYLTEGRERDAVRDLLRIAAVRGAGPGEVDSLRAAFAGLRANARYQRVERGMGFPPR